MLRAGQNIVLVADHTKFGKTVFAKVCDLSQVDIIVTDSALPKPIADQIKEHGIELRIADSIVPALAA
jgi:DeoR family transcriptional regulator of aga operon